ncbi:hypothetical protein DPMN_032144 [Dreissena polymorpha]|uniref:Uncharacterized protein n=1 Tax=Dreissena polymorpha TaxID=45954 RepID=A0A9D4M450_DREPO|nr:hypothetical protein DPMN_032144 [Dreissena polymorpha]
MKATSAFTLSKLISWHVLGKLQYFSCSYSVTSSKWVATETVSQAEDSLKLRDIVGLTAVGHEGFGATKAFLWIRSDKKERRAMIQAEVRKSEENKRQTRKVDIETQGAWTGN